MNKKQPLYLFIVLILLTACNAQKQKASYQTPIDINDGWTISTLQDNVLDSLQLKTLLANLPKQSPQLNALVIAHQGQLIVDQYYNGYDAHQKHKIWSITKLISNSLIAIAQENHLLKTADSISSYLSEYLPDSLSSKNNIQIEQLLQMKSGLDWVELGGPSSQGFQMAYSNNWPKFVLTQPHKIAAEPSFNYSSGNSILLAPILKKATQLEADQYAQQVLFVPLNITDYQWDRQAEFWTKTEGGELPGAVPPKDLDYDKNIRTLSNTATGLRLRPRDLCKIGQLYLQKGQWKQQTILPQGWCETAFEKRPSTEAYVYHWKKTLFNQYDCYFTTGFGLQRIFVIPDLELVVTMNQSYYQNMPEGNQATLAFMKELVSFF